ncbi:MAG: tonB dependent receptor family protein [Massilia sp.]|jgi:iron complex outermembrane receptor protein|nr:tonB dependent receptor family protein [Massilia sp.]MDB5950223.1 tonB dependent receptor family protein [Massilia sp.]
MVHSSTAHAPLNVRFTPLAQALIGCFSLSMLGSPAIANAQAAPADKAEGQIQEVIVTAQKRKENLREAPVSAVVMTAESLVKSGVETLDDVGKLVPSLVAAPTGGALRSGFTMRGISTTVQTIGAPSGTAVMIDGVTLAPESMAAKQLSDIANLEVLRGPQATLGGRTASTGVINIVTRTPEASFSGKVGVTFTDDKQRRVEGFVTGPVTDMLKFSLSGYDGKTYFPTKNLTTGQFDSEEASGIRGKLLFTPIKNLDVTLTASSSDMDSKGTFQTYILVDPAAKYRGFIPNAASLPGVVPGIDNFDYAVRNQPSTVASDKLYSLVVNYKLGDWSLSSITARQEEDRTLVADVHNQASDWASLLTNGKYSWDQSQQSILNVRTTSQEFKVISPQIGIVNVLAGAYYGHDETAYDFVRSSFGIPAGPSPFSANRAADTKTTALYGRATWTLTPALSLVTGLRANRDDIGYLYNLRYTTTPASASVPFTRTGSATQDTTVGDANLRFTINPNLMTYVSYSRGYKPAIWNLDGTITPTNEVKAVNKENVDAFELGMKGVFLNRRLTLNAALFSTTYTDFQVQTFDPISPSATFALSNAGKARTRGIELDGRAVLPADFRLNASLAYIDAKFIDYAAATCYTAQTVAQGCVASVSGSRYQRLSGTTLPNAPKWKINLGVDKTVQFESLPFDLKFNANYNYQTAVNFDPNGNPIAVQRAYGIVNLSTNLIDRAGRYDVSFFVNNLANTHYVAGMTDQGARWGNLSALTGWRSRDSERYMGIRLNAYF